MIDQTNSRFGFRSCLYAVVAGFWLVSGMMPAMVDFDRFDASLKAALKAMMIRFIDNASDDEGGFRYIKWRAVGSKSHQRLPKYPRLHIRFNREQNHQTGLHIGLTKSVPYFFPVRV